MSDNFNKFKEKAKLLKDSSDFLVQQTNDIVDEFESSDLDLYTIEELEDLLKKMDNLQNKISYEQREYLKFLNEYE